MGRRLDITELDKSYGEWTVIGEGGYIGKTRRRAIQCVCVCGVSRNVSLSDLLNGSSRSCGCVTYGNHKHGACTKNISRLYRCWQSMKDRSRMRVAEGELCLVFEPWSDYAIFAEWSLDNGYTDDMLLCRNGDVGDYVPNNCRWDTRRSNTVEATAKHYIALNPQGIVTSIYNLSKFCRDHKLNSGQMRRVMNGEIYYHRGWTQYIKENH